MVFVKNKISIIYEEPSTLFNAKILSEYFSFLMHQNVTSPSKLFRKTLDSVNHLSISEALRVS